MEIIKDMYEGDNHKYEKYFWKDIRASSDYKIALGVSLKSWIPLHWL